MRVRRSRATSAGISPRWTASCRADSVWERMSVGARSLCAPGTSTPALARWRTALASTTNLVIGYLRSGVGASQHYRRTLHGRHVRRPRRAGELGYDQVWTWVWALGHSDCNPARSGDIPA